MMSFDRLKDIREDNEISQEKMAQILGVNRSTYSLWELGINIIPLKYLCDFANYFNLSLDYIVGLTNDRNTKSKSTELILKTIGNNLKEIRLKNNLSQENIASLLNVTQPAITRYEKGLVCISVSNLYKYSKEFNISLDSLCGRTF